MDEFLADAIKLYRTLQASKNSVVNSPVVSTGTDDQAVLTPRRAQNVVVVPGPNDSDNFADVSASAESEEAAESTPVAIAARTTSTSGSTWDYVETFAFRDRLKQAGLFDYHETLEPRFSNFSIVSNVLGVFARLENFKTRLRI